jgi:membrane protein implicated in regulation of membrane protease activity
MLVIVGLVVLLVAAIVGVTGVLNTGSTGTLFLFGIVIGALAMLGLSVLLAGARRTAVRGRDARRELNRSQREAAFVNRDAGLEHRQVDEATGAAVTPAATTRPKRGSLFGRLSRGRQPTDTSQAGGRR